MSLCRIRQSLLKGFIPRASRCMYCTKSEGDPPKQTVSKTQEPVKPVATKAKPAPPTEEIDDNTKYQCDSYLNHDILSFYNIEAQMTARRVGQPSSKEPLVAP